MPFRRAASTLTVLIVAAACSSGGGVPSGGGVVRIGVDLPLTGPEAQAAAPALDGARYYVATHPTIGGLTIELAVSDDARGAPASPALGAANLHAFVADSRVLAVIGPLDGAVAREEIPIANAAGLAMVAPATSNPCLTRDVYLPGRLNPAGTDVSCKQAGVRAASELRPNGAGGFFRLATTDDLQGAAAADYAYSTLHVLRAGVVADGEAYGQALASAFAARFTRLGGSVVGRTEIDPANPNASAFLQRMKAERAQAIYYGGGAAGCAVRAQMAGVFPPGEAAPFLGGDAIAEDPDCLSAAGAQAPGIFATAPIADASAAATSARVLEGLRKAFPGRGTVGPYTLLAYDATAVVYAAVGRAVSAAGGRPPSRASVVAELARTAGFVGTTGTIGFDPAGDTTNRVVSVYEASGANAGSAWRLAGAVDYSARLPY